MNILTPKVKIAIVDDHNLFRKGLIKLLNLMDAENKYSIAFEAENGSDLKEKLTKKNMPDIITMDIDMPEINGYEAVHWLNQYFPDINVLVISMLESEEAVLKMLQLGVEGYISKDIEVEDMQLALEALTNNRKYYSELVTDIMAANIQNSGTDGRAQAGRSIELNAKEREFIKLACTGLTYHQIAAKMHQSPKTIDGYREALFIKLNVKNRTSLAMYGVINGIVTPSELVNLHKLQN
jgi:two-component system invasion response regulator UvrY